MFRECFPWALLTGVPLAIGAAGLFGACRAYQVAGPWRQEIAAAVPAAAERVDLELADAPARWHWERRAALSGDAREICDLASSPAGLLVASSRAALMEDGAALYRLDEHGAVETLLEWPGQGFLRVHAHGNRVVVPDADAPFSFLEFAFRWDVDGYVFISDERGAFDEGARETLPATYHVFDAARLRDGRLVASAGAYPPGETAYFSDHAPAALLVDDGPGRPWRRLLDHPAADAIGVSRFTYLLPLDDGALLAGVQTSRPDLPAAVRIAGLPDAPMAKAVTGLVGETLRWASWRGAVYHVAQLGRTTRLSVSRDGGRRFTPLAVDAPQSLAASQDALFLLAGGALWASRDGDAFVPVGPAHPVLAHAPSPLISAPLTVHRGRLFAGSPRTGELFEWVRE